MQGDSSACAPANLSFYGNIDVADTAQLQWQWNFSNNKVYTDQNPAPVAFQQDGVYTAFMTVTNSSGCVTVRIKQINIHPLPLVNAGDNYRYLRKENSYPGSHGGRQI